MARVTSADVAAIIDYDATTITDLTPFITAANLIINEKMAGSGVSEALLTEMERWLAAHFLAIRARVAEREKIGDAEVSIGGKYGYALDSTLWGQQAKALDPTGTLVNIGKRPMSIQAVPS